MARTSKQPTTRDLQAIERRKQLLAAATELFAKQGYHGTPIREINRKIGMADGLLYHYFPGGKLEILQTIANEAMVRRTQMIEGILVILDDSTPLRDIMMKALHFLYGMLQQERLVLQIQVSERELLEGDINKQFEDMILQRIGLIEGLLEKRAKAGDIRQMDMALAARQFMNIWLSVIFQTMVGFDLIRGDLDDYFNSMVDHILDTWRP